MNLIYFFFKVLYIIKIQQYLYVKYYKSEDVWVMGREFFNNYCLQFVEQDNFFQEEKCYIVVFYLLGMCRVDSFFM